MRTYVLISVTIAAALLLWLGGRPSRSKRLPEHGAVREGAASDHSGARAGAAPSAAGARAGAAGDPQALGLVEALAKFRSESSRVVFPDPTVAAPPLTSAQKAEQDLVADYFRSSVAPKARDCFSRLGKGRITFHYHYIRGEHGWQPVDSADAVEVHDSELPDDDDEKAVTCMREAIKGTTMPVSSMSERESTYDIFWGWQAPAPSLQN